MKFKKWNVAVLLLVVLIFGAIAVTNVIVDPLGYFAFQSGDYAKINFPADTTYYQRLLKAKHVQNFGDDYDAYLIGGSKAGAYQTENLTKLDGYTYYNMFELGGNFYEYEKTADFILANTTPKKIILNISGSEVRAFQNDSKNLTFQIPAIVDGTSQLTEFFEFLFMDFHKSQDRLEERRTKTQYYELQEDGSRNLQKYYKYVAVDPTKFTEKHVLKPFDNHMKTLFTTNVERAYYQDNLDALKRIKNKCEAAGVELQVIVAPAFIGEMSEHDTTYYRDYLLDMATITDYWDFSGYNDINLNPYNYYNEGHFYYEIASLIIDTINGTDSYPGFGVYVTKENAAEHVAERAADYERLKEEYDTTGTIQLQGLEDDSYIPGRK